MKYITKFGSFVGCLFTSFVITTHTHADTTNVMYRLYNPITMNISTPLAQKNVIT